MTKKLRMRIMLTMLLLLSVTYIAILITINVWSFANTKSDADDALRFLIQQHGEPTDTPPISIPDKEKLPPDKPDSFTTKNQRTKVLSSHYILVRYRTNGTIESIDNTLSSDYSDEKIIQYCEEILQKKKNHGDIGQLRYQIRKNTSGTEIFFVDHTAEHQSSQRLLLISIILGVVGLIAFAIVSYVISGLMVRPVEDAFKKQKQFISDASHELKTPITVILSSSELLEDQIGNNQWLSYIKKECDRMRNLVESLLTLTRLEQNPSTDMIKSNFSLSDAMLERILPFESIAFEKEIRMHYDIQPDIEFFGVREQLQELLVILMDNAQNHTEPGGNININLQKTSHHIHLLVSNTGEPIAEEERTKLFERFYRIDKARNRTEGRYGLGLAIAKTIVENHHGKIAVQCEAGITTFTASFPIKK